MYFYLSKTLGFLAIPSNLIPVIIVCGLLLWRSRCAWIGRRITVVGILLLLIAGITPLGTVLLLPLENRFPPGEALRGAPTGVIVLGGIIRSHTSLLRGRITFDAAVDRLLAAIELHRQYPAARIVFSGGNSNLIFKGVSESELAVKFLENSGVPSDDIEVDRAARNTMENAVNAKTIAAPKPGEQWLLITSAFHMPRAIGLFRTAGFPVEAYPVDWKTGGWGDVDVLPSSMLGGLSYFDVAAHEWEGLFVDWITRRTSTLFPGPADAASGG